MPKRFTTLALTISAFVLLSAALVAGIWFTAGDQTTRRRPARMAAPVDLQPLETAQQLEKLATTREEFWLAYRALRRRP